MIAKFVKFYTQKKNNILAFICFKKRYYTSFSSWDVRKQNRRIWGTLYISPSIPHLSPLVM